MNALGASGLENPGMWLAGGANGAGMAGRSTNMELLNAFGVSMRRALPGVGGMAEISHQDSAMGIVVSVAIAAFEGSVEASYYFTGDPLFIRANWPNERFNFPNVSQDLQYTAGYTLWHINALMDLATQGKMEARDVVQACYDYERDAKRERRTVVGDPLHDEETNHPDTPMDEESVRRFVCDLANMPADRQNFDRLRPLPGESFADDDRREVIARRALLLIGVVGATTDSRVRGSYEPYYHVFGARMSSTVTMMANVWRAHAHEEIGYAYGYFKVDVDGSGYPYDEVWNTIAAGKCGDMPQPQDAAGDRVPWYVPQIMPVVCENRNSEVRMPFGVDPETAQMLTVNKPRRVWVCRALDEKTWAHFTPVFVHRLGRIMYGRQDGAVPTARAARAAMRTYAGAKALRSGFLGDGNEAGEFAVQVDIDISRRIYWQETYPQCR